jgi:hypothetical protein
MPRYPTKVRLPFGGKIRAVADPKSLPLQITSIKLEVAKLPVAPVAPEQLMRLAVALSPTYTQTNQLPNGIQLSNPQLRRFLVYDLSKVLISEDLVTNTTDTIAQIDATLQSVHQVLPLTPPFPSSAMFAATIQLLNQNATEILMKSIGQVATDLRKLCDQYMGAGLRFLYTKGLFTIDLRLEPLFADVRKVFVSALFQRTQTPLQTFEELTELLKDCLSQLDNGIAPTIYEILSRN